MQKSRQNGQLCTPTKLATRRQTLLVVNIPPTIRIYADLSDPVHDGHSMVTAHAQFHDDIRRRVWQLSGGP
jgi:hypothetical protein